jgi:hypothetical protein
LVVDEAIIDDLVEHKANNHFPIGLFMCNVSQSLRFVLGKYTLVLRLLGCHFVVDGWQRENHKQIRVSELSVLNVLDFCYSIQDKHIQKMGISRNLQHGNSLLRAATTPCGMEVMVILSTNLQDFDTPASTLSLTGSTSITSLNSSCGWFSGWVAIPQVALGQDPVLSCAEQI